MKISNNFTVQELVHKDIINVLGEGRAANTISTYLISSLEKLRNHYGAIRINGGGYKNSGLRKASYYRKFGIIRESYSTHQYGNTADLKFSNGVKPAEVFDFILANQEKFPYIVRMENAHETRTWLHIECGKFKGKKIEVFNT